jgi:hypothetical protein
MNYYSSAPGRPAIVIITAATASLIGIGGWFLGLYLTARLFCEGRQKGELELLLTSGITEVQLIQSVWHCLRPWWIARGIIELLGQIALFSTTSAYAAFNWVFIAVFITTQFLSTVIGGYAGYWIAMWFGASSSSMPKAMGKILGIFGLANLMLIQVTSTLVDQCLPHITFSAGSGTPSAMGSGFVVPPLFYIAWAWWARQRMFTQLRTTVAGDSPKRRPRPSLRRILWGPLPSS